MKYGATRYWPTWKIEAVLADPHYRGVDNTDFGPIAEELRSELWSRTDKQDRERERADEAMWQAYEDYLEAS